MALSAIGEGCHQQMEAILQEIVNFVLQFCGDAVRRLNEHNMHVILMNWSSNMKTVHAITGHFEIKPVYFRCY